VSPGRDEQGNPATIRAECWEVVVVGAGPAGATAARGLAERGVRVLLVDRAVFPRHKVCGACVGPTALAWLRRDGLDEVVEDLDARPLPTLDLRAGERRAEIGLGEHRAVPRSRLDATLVDAAVRAGAVFRDGCIARLAGGRNGWVGLETGAGALRARAVVDAAGLTGVRISRRQPGGGSALARPIDMDLGTPVDGDTRVDAGARIGLGAVFTDDAYGPPPGVLRMVVGRNGYVGAVRDGDGALTVAAAVAPEAVEAHGPAGAVETVLSEAGLPMPEGRFLHPWKGTPRLTRAPARLGGAGMLRIGDAAGYVEPFTGEGIGWAIGSGVAVRPFAERAIEGWSEEIAVEWSAEYRRVIRCSQRTCRGLAGALRHVWLARLAVAALAHAPGLASPFVRATGGMPQVSAGSRVLAP
jgi:hypothetical protein